MNNDNDDEQKKEKIMIENWNRSFRSLYFKLRTAETNPLRREKRRQLRDNYNKFLAERAALRDQNKNVDEVQQLYYKIQSGLFENDQLDFDIKSNPDIDEKSVGKLTDEDINEFDAFLASLPDVNDISEDEDDSNPPDIPDLDVDELDLTESKEIPNLDRQKSIEIENNYQEFKIKLDNPDLKVMRRVLLCRDILTLMCGFLKVQDLYTLSTVDHLYRKIVSHPKIWSNVFERQFGYGSCLDWSTRIKSKNIYNKCKYMIQNSEVFHFDRAISKHIPNESHCYGQKHLRDLVVVNNATTSKRGLVTKYPNDDSSGAVCLRPQFYNFAQNDFALTIVFKSNVIGNWKRLVTKRFGLTWFSLCVHKGFIALQLSSNQILFATKTVVNDGLWHVATVNCKDNIFSLIVDGKYNSQFDAGDEWRASSASKSILEVGRYKKERYDNTNFVGTIRTLSIINNSSLHLKEIQAQHERYENQFKNNGAFALPKPTFIETESDEFIEVDLKSKQKKNLVDQVIENNMEKLERMQSLKRLGTDYRENSKNKDKKNSKENNDKNSEEKNSEEKHEIGEKKDNEEKIQQQKYKQGTTQKFTYAATPDGYITDVEYYIKGTSNFMDHKPQLSLSEHCRLNDEGLFFRKPNSCSTNAKLLTNDNFGTFNPKNKSFSVYLKFKTVVSGCWKRMVSKKNKYSKSFFSLALNNSAPIFEISPSLYTHASTRVTDGNWHEVVAVCDRKTHVLKLYVDGRMEASANIQPEYSIENDAPIRFGALGYDKFGGDFDGTISRFKFFKRALDKDEVLFV